MIYVVSSYDGFVAYVGLSREAAVEAAADLCYPVLSVWVDGEEVSREKLGIGA